MSQKVVKVLFQSIVFKALTLLLLVFFISCSRVNMTKTKMVISYSGSGSISNSNPDIKGVIFGRSTQGDSFSIFIDRDDFVEHEVKNIAPSENK